MQNTTARAPVQHTFIYPLTHPYNPTPPYTHTDLTHPQPHPNPYTHNPARSGRGASFADCNTLNTLPHTATYEYLSAEWKWRERGSALQSKRQQQQMSSLPALSSEISICNLKTPFSSTKTSGVPQTATCVWSKETIESKQADVLCLTAKLGNQKKFPVKSYLPLISSRTAPHSLSLSNRFLFSAQRHLFCHKGRPAYGQKRVDFLSASSYCCVNYT